MFYIDLSRKCFVFRNNMFTCEEKLLVFIPTHKPPAIQTPTIVVNVNTEQPGADLTRQRKAGANIYARSDIFLLKSLKRGFCTSSAWRAKHFPLFLLLHDL